jgi:hypothetical protein
LDAGDHERVAAMALRRAEVIYPATCSGVILFVRELPVRELLAELFVRTR